MPRLNPIRKSHGIKAKRIRASRNSTKGGNHGKLRFWPVDAWKDDYSGEKTRAARAKAYKDTP